MSAYSLVIAPAAKNDLREIYQYGLRLWGKAQSDKYLATIKDHFWSLTEQPLMGIERPDIQPNIRSLSIQTHTLFYRVTANQVEVIRVLHGRQDPQRHFS